MGINTELRIPDLWYDFYTRLLPGTAFVVCFRQFILGGISELTWLQVLVTLGIGYFCGLLVAPLGSRITGWILWLFDTNGYVEKAKILLGPEGNEAVILSKMQGECCFFVQLLVLCAVFLILYHFDGLWKARQEIPCIWVVTVGLLVYCLLGSFEVAHRRRKRATLKVNALEASSTGGTP